MKSLGEEHDAATRAILHAIIDGYLETADAVDVPAIATRLKWSEARVRKAMGAMGGCPNGAVARQETRPSYSRSYRGMQSGSHRVWVYQPTLATLRVLLLAARAELTELRGPVL